MEQGILKLFWKFYSFLFLAIVSSNASHLLNKNSVFGIYYSIMMVFSSWFVLPYFLNILNALIGCIVCVFIFAYAFDAKKLSRVPQWFFYLCLLSDATGHSYEFKMVQSGFAAGKPWGFIALASLILPVLPSYILLWQMCFSHKNKAL